VRKNERYSAFPPAVSQAFLEVSDLRVNFYRFTFSYPRGVYTQYLAFRTQTVASTLNIKCSKFTRGLEPLYGDARSAKSFEVLALIFSTDCSPIDWLQSVLKFTLFENVFLFYFFFLKIRRHVRGG
jgi:hypothetical protein